MKLADFKKSRATLAGVGLVIFAVLAIVTLQSDQRGGQHPLALEAESDLCSLLGEGVWVELGYPAGNPVARVPATDNGDATVCALELDPVPPGDRFARVARGDDAGETRRIATVRLVTNASLQASNPETSTDRYVEAFGRELEADGWSGEETQGPWTWGAMYTAPEDRAAMLIEDHGIVLWTTATGVTPDNLVQFTHT
ncbi:MAG TPA: hypothetical protein VMP00_04290, partial [Burkholderiales bacterium]|nr:hypothetical protein [Burkholderiales bacterium]